ncbi:MAG: hypothetical protein ABRQ37_22655 [Candidatus Eremiobacterota bacterium]
MDIFHLLKLLYKLSKHMGWGQGVETFIGILAIVIAVVYLFVIYKVRNKVKLKEKTSYGKNKNVPKTDKISKDTGSTGTTYEDGENKIDEEREKICECGEPLKEGQKFCIICGATLK